MTTAPADMDAVVDALVGERIRSTRLMAGFTQDELAQALGNVNRSTVARWERGLRGVSIGTLLRIAAILRVSVTDLLPSPPPSDAQRAAQALLNRRIEEQPELLPALLDHLEQLLSTASSATR